MKTLQRARAAVLAARSAPDATAGWVRALDALAGLDRVELVEVAAMLAGVVGRREAFVVGGVDPTAT